MSMKPFRTDNECHVHVLPITLTLGTCAHIRCIIFTRESAYDKTYTLDGDDYAKWGNDDDYVKNYICVKEPYIGRPLTDINP